MIILKLNIFAWEGLADESAISDELTEGGLTILPKDLKPKQVSQYLDKEWLRKQDSNLRQAD